jgi:hypothetical protein
MGSDPTTAFSTMGLAVQVEAAQGVVGAGEAAGAGAMCCAGIDGTRRSRISVLPTDGGRPTPCSPSCGLAVFAWERSTGPAQGRNRPAPRGRGSRPP